MEIVEKNPIEIELIIDDFGSNNREENGGVNEIEQNIVLENKTNKTLGQILQEKKREKMKGF